MRKRTHQQMRLAYDQGHSNGASRRVNAQSPRTRVAVAPAPQTITERLANAAGVAALTVLIWALLFMLLSTHAAPGPDNHAKGDHTGQASADPSAAYGQPAAPHEKLSRMAGTWEVRGRIYGIPGQGTVEMNGKSTNRMILGGRFLQSEFEAMFMGQKFWGMGIEGHDNETGTFNSQWMDSMNTRVHMMEGKADKSGKVITYTGMGKDAATGESVEEKTIVNIRSFTTYSVQSWQKAPGQEEFGKTMEFVYTKLPEDKSDSKTKSRRRDGER